MQYYIFIGHDVDGISLFPRSESGIYYALHVGGTNFRILRIQLGGQRSILGHDVERRPIPPHLMTRTSEVQGFKHHDAFTFHEFSNVFLQVSAI